MVKFLKRLHYSYFMALLMCCFIVFLPFYYLLSRNASTYSWLNKCRQCHGFIVCTLSGIFFRFRFEEALSTKQTYIYCANHTSNLDIIIFCLLAKGRFHFMGKEELSANPVLGIFFSTIDIPVDRESKISAFRAFKRAGQNLDRGMSLVIFPEGKIDDIYPPKLQTFKNGPFRLAITHNIAIVPVSIENVWNIMWDDGAKFGTRPGIVNIYVHKPISTAILAAENDEILKDKVFNIVNSRL